METVTWEELQRRLEGSECLICRAPAYNMDSLCPSHREEWSAKLWGDTPPIAEEFRERVRPLTGAPTNRFILEFGHFVTSHVLIEGSTQVIELLCPVCEQRSRAQGDYLCERCR